MGKINVLDEQLANQIAAGEVVERPSSVVKELVENAVDAGSTTIDVEVEEGGLTLIRVKDNGSGIDPEDIETAFQRHATSKLLSSKDLFRIASLGFRGEALPSIAAVARVECVTSPEESGLGRRLVMEGGTVKALEDVNTPQGTVMTVKDLFYNTPARLKYMKSIQTELGHISDYINRLALAHPGIAFTLSHNGNTLLRTQGTGDRLQVIAAVYGTGVAKSMLAVSGDHPDYELMGYISKPELTRSNRNSITVIVNGRYIRSFVLNQAIMQAYHTLLPINRFPVAVLEIGMHPGLVDVNVHPSKMEVRFSKEPELRTFIEQVLKEKLGAMVHIPGQTEAERSKPVYVQERISFHKPEPGFPAPSASEQSKRGSSQAEQRNSGMQGGREYSSSTVDRGRAWQPAAGYRDQQQEQPIPPDAAERLYKPSSTSGQSQAVQEAAAAWETASPVIRAGDGYPRSSGLENGMQPGSGTAPAYPSEPVDNGQNAAGNGTKAADKPEGSGFPELSWIGQLHGTYFVAQNEDGLYLIDQHAAHERINYEYYFRKFGEPESLSQSLLVPLTLEFTAGEAVLIRERLDAFREAGVELEPFGQNAFLVRAYPQWLPEGEEQPILEEMADWVLSEKKAVDLYKLREKAAILCSCKASIKANHRMSREEAEVLLARLAACEQPYTCPHGRPIVVHISTYQLEKMFKRVMS
ncbi:DNA mismatch repair endonuclease MutL [Paenibacillus sambharensis]|uniref:DNA mismatch repair protein MutL n=1 Tax=Paenibacillus sambharensis TaxID=1803190 RepID=A0A2W1LQF6_9BACL|nr:DNA mismatch repair endonuclease MutL [Paenibacillus sambharensis]PZD93637.1 DNA mismatch repair endonuclease MutL [Paenibacillus sambharensis]